MNKEVRSVQAVDFATEVTADNKKRLTGYAAVFDKPTLMVDINGNTYYEVIDRNAFRNTNMKKCCMRYNHESAYPVMCRVRGGSLQLAVDDYGLHFDGELFDTSANTDIYAIVSEGGIDECSFAFTIAEGGHYFDKATRTKHITDIAILWDVSVVDHPAYDEGTSVVARSVLRMQYRQKLRMRQGQKNGAPKSNALKFYVRFKKNGNQNRNY